MLLRHVVIGLLSNRYNSHQDTATPSPKVSNCSTYRPQGLYEEVYLTTVHIGLVLETHLLCRKGTTTRTSWPLEHTLETGLTPDNGEIYAFDVLDKSPFSHDWWVLQVECFLQSLHEENRKCSCLLPLAALNILIYSTSKVV